MPPARRRGGLRRLVVGTAIAAAAGMTLSTVVFTPPPAAAAAAADEATYIEKSKAARVFGIEAGEDLLTLGDRDFVAAMYYIADDRDKPRPLEPEHQKLKEAAIAALAAGDAACLQFIKAGIFAANDQDRTIVTDRRQRQEEERTAKARAAAALSIPVDNIILAKPVFEFIVHLELNADNHKDMAVKQAARVALSGTAEAQWAFLTVGVHDEHRKDLDRLIREDKEKTEAEKAAELAREAKANAAYHALGYDREQAKNLITKTDQDFVIEVWNRAPAGTEVAGAAEAAVRSLDPAVWKKFIDTGAREARLRDIQIALDRRDKEYIRQITEVRTRAANSLVYPALVAAADAALAGTPTDRERFLRVGQYENQNQSLRFDLAESYIADNNGDVVMAPWRPGAHPAHAWKIEPGLSNPTCFSFQSVSRSNHYLHWRKDLSAKSGGSVPQKLRAYAKVDPTDGSAQFKAEATWCVKRNGAGISIHPVEAASNYLYVVGAIDNENGGQSAVWHVEAPQPQLPMDRRYASDQGLRDRLGKPVGDAVLDENHLGYKEYEKGRLYLVANDYGSHKRPEVHVVYKGPILDKLLSLGGPNPLGGKFSDQVATQDGRGQVVRIEKPNSGGQNLYIIWSPETNAHIVYGSVGDVWAENGAETGTYGYPVTDVERYGEAGIVYIRFTRGTIYHVPNAGIRQVKGEIHQRFAAMGFEAGLGAPLTDEVRLEYVWRQTFEKGRIDKNTVGGFAWGYQTVPMPHRAIQFKGFASGRCMQMAGTHTGAHAELWDCTAGTNQIFDVISRGNNKYTLKNRSSGQCLVHMRSSQVPPYVSQTSSCDFTWEFTTAPDGTLALRDPTGLVIEAKSRGTANGTQVIMAWDVTLDYQRWTITPVK